MKKPPTPAAPEMKDCPFCGGAAEYSPGRTEYVRPAVRCSCCGILGPRTTIYNPAAPNSIITAKYEAVQAWNHRP